MTTATKLLRIARRYGARHDRSPISETIYFLFGPVRLRVSGHELGYADYGSRRQVHHGPEIVYACDAALAEIIAAALAELRDYLRGGRACTWRVDQRREAAATLRHLRAMYAHETDPRRLRRRATDAARAEKRRAEREAARRAKAELATARRRAAYTCQVYRRAAQAAAAPLAARIYAHAAAMLWPDWSLPQRVLGGGDPSDACQVSSRVLEAVPPRDYFFARTDLRDAFRHRRSLGPQAM